MTHLLRQVVLGDSMVLPNRICMGSMTRNRCVDDSKPTDTTAEYYAQRAKAGLIVAEGTFIGPHGSEFTEAPIMCNEGHVKAWKQVVDRVHLAGGKVFFQPWHAGRIQNEQMPLLRENNCGVEAPSNVPAEGGRYRMLRGSPGHAREPSEIEDIEAIVERYQHSVTLAKQAGFDGIELLSLGGYLIHSFLCTHANVRHDEYGGSVENRCRFPLQVLDAIIQVWGSDKVAIKIGPTDILNDSATTYAELQETYHYYIKELVARRLAYINISRRGCDPALRPAGKELPPGYDSLREFGGLIKRPDSKTLLMVNNDYTVAEADALIDNGVIDMVSFGRPFIYNPDMIERVEHSIPFAINDRGDMVNYGPYQHVRENYTDWPTVPAV